jgi:hypothetical protein
VCGKQDERARGSELAKSASANLTRTDFEIRKVNALTGRISAGFAPETIADQYLFSNGPNGPDWKFRGELTFTNPELGRASSAFRSAAEFGFPDFSVRADGRPCLP